MLLYVKGKNESSIYAVRKSFLHKLLKWYGISHHSITHLADDTLVLMCNDTLRAISSNSSYINLKIENNEAISIVSKKFTLSSDLDVIDLVKNKVKIDRISRDDFGMRIFTKITAEAEPIVGDISGFGLNITNSETGFSTLKAEHYILRYWCTNGCTTKIKQSPINIVHYNKPKSEIYKDLSIVLDSAPKEPEFFTQGVLKSLEEKAQSSFPDISFKINAILGNKAGYNFFNEFNRDKSKYDLFNHITHSAKRFDIMERYKLEKLAGTLIF